MTGETLDLWAETRPEYGESDLEASIRSTIERIHAKQPLNDVQRALARLSRALAKNIDLGNRKGRAIANEAAQLSELMQLIGGGDEENPTDAYDTRLQEMFDAFSAPTPARPDTTETRHDSAQL